MEKEIIISAESYKGKIKLDYVPCINYAMVLNKKKTFGKFDVYVDKASQSWRNVNITITGDMILPYQKSVTKLNAGEAISLDDSELIPVATKLMALSEAMQSSFVICVSIDGQEVVKHALHVTFMAYDQWHGINVSPELITSFVTPNHPLIAAICKKASNLLGECYWKNSLDDYQSGNTEWIAKQVEAVYTAIQQSDITYATCPASFEEYGQRIRMVDKILKDKMGNCMDLSLLMCSCLESIGVNSVLLLFKGHAMMGFWLKPMSCRSTVFYDTKALKVSCQGNDQELEIIDATALTRGATIEQAIKDGHEHLEKKTKEFQLLVDVFGSRTDGVRPLPHVTQSDSGFSFTEQALAEGMSMSAPELNSSEIRGTVSASKLKNKQQLWERKLLDLSLRNSLLNMKTGKNILHVNSLPISEVLIHLKNGTLVNDLDVKDIELSTKDLYRSARLSIEENGANTLFLSIGTLRWYEEGDSRPYLAPLLFLPVEIVRPAAHKYIIRPRDEEPIINITLMEMLRQSFDIELPSISVVSENDEEPVVWKCAFSAISKAIEAINKKRQYLQWEIMEECHVGIFSFSKFVMWSDIHHNADVLSSHPLLQSLIEGRSMINEASDDMDARTLDFSSKPADYALPLDVDSSQLEAVVKSGNGQSFVLYGPPGTGKSQTITNMIANALYQNKRVLFVSEKKAALEVVQERLKNIGLMPFCLELHSNKVDKKTFLAQMESVLNVTEQATEDTFNSKSEELYNIRRELMVYIERLHMTRQQGLSLYEYINRYLDVDGEVMPLTYNDISHLNIDKVNDICDRMVTMDKIAGIIGEHPSRHPLLGLYPLENTAENQRSVTDSLDAMKTAILSAKKKEQSLWNKWFKKRTALQILRRSKTWEDLTKVAMIDEGCLLDIDNLSESIELWSKHVDKLRQWYHYSLLALKMNDYDTDFVMRYYLQGHNGKETADAFRRGYYMRMAMNIIDEDETMRGFNGILFDDIIQQYRKYSKQFQTLTQKELVHRLSARVASIEKGGKVAKEEMTIMKKRITNHGRGTSVRRIIEQTRHILPQLCPCMLMSPLSVAQYLEMSRGQFDLVIFDEASQMPTSEAVGAIARGKAVIVVGDPMQMPPTSFFMTNNTNEDDIDVDDMESILEDCISLSLPNRYLSWHYRSKHESLISFSNRHFYDGRLITFPSVDDQQRRVTMQYVDGYYDFGKTRSNKAEAKAIVTEVLDRLRKQLPTAMGGEDVPLRSIGIVAFSKVQSGIIEDMLTDALSKEPELEEIATKSQEPIFVKNLENVQGDERDIILFSVGYGPDKQGKVSMNFGPLNQMGGERRLNVAVTRARHEMKVFSTLHPHQIDLQRTGAKGVVALKRFLEFAETGILPCPINQVTEQKTDNVTTSVAEALEDMGYNVHQNVGSSQFKIDIAIEDPDYPGCYKTGIIIDTKNYFDTQTVRDREVVRPAILGALGWDIHNIWSVDWIENEDICLKCIIDVE